MAANPKRKGISTLPVYLPDVPVRRAPVKKGEEAAEPQIYVEGGFKPEAAEALAESLVKKGGLAATIAGEMLSSLPRGPQLAFRHKVAIAGRGLAAARILGDVRSDAMVRRGDVDEEEALLHAKSKPEITNAPEDEIPAGLTYDGSSVQAVYRDLLPKAKGGNIVVTSRALRAWDKKKRAWVAQPVVAGNPVVVGADAGTDAAALAKQISAALS